MAESNSVARSTIPGIPSDILDHQSPGSAIPSGSGLSEARKAINMPTMYRSSRSFKLAFTGLLLLSDIAVAKNTLLLSTRAEDEGSACSDEGQWNCMEHSWQRCGGGIWSKEMPLSDGTKCTPSGLTDDVEIEHDGDDGDDDDDDSGNERNDARGCPRPFGDVRGWGLIGATICFGAVSAVVSSAWTEFW